MHKLTLGGFKANGTIDPQRRGAAQLSLLPQSEFLNNIWWY